MKRKVVHVKLGRGSDKAVIQSFEMVLEIGAADRIKIRALVAKNVVPAEHGTVLYRSPSIFSLLIKASCLAVPLQLKGA
jgi:hypothetical protein